MLGPDLGPNVEVFYKLYQAGVTNAQMAEVARLFVDQAQEKANVAAVKGGQAEPSADYFAWAVGETLLEWQKRARSEKRRTQPIKAARPKTLTLKQLLVAMLSHLKSAGWQTEEQLEDVVRGRAPHNDIIRALALGLESAQITVEKTGVYAAPVRFGLPTTTRGEKQ